MHAHFPKEPIQIGSRLVFKDNEQIEMIDNNKAQATGPV
jgi:hypothetical protein